MLHSGKYNPEQQLLLWTIRTDSSTDDLLKEALSLGVNWPALLESARDHGLIPLLYMRLQTLEEGLVQQDAFQKLKLLYRMNTLRNFSMLQQLVRLLTLLAERGVNAIPVKGITLALQAYKDIALRHFVDLDIFLPNADDFYIAYQVLLENGFHVEETIAQQQVARLLQQVNNQLFSSKDCFVEVHWAFPEREYGFMLDGKELWSRINHLPLESKTFCTLSIEDAFLLHVLHGTKHQWCKLSWIADLAYLCKNANPDWAIITAQAKRLRVVRILHTALLLTARMCGVSYPADLQKSIEGDRHASKLVDYIESVLFASEEQAIDTFPKFILNSRERLRDKIHYLMYPRVDDQTMIALPEALFPLYYLLRPMRLLCKMVKVKGERILSPQG